MEIMHVNNISNNQMKYKNHLLILKNDEEEKDEVMSLKVDLCNQKEI